MKAKINAKLDARFKQLGIFTEVGEDIYPISKQKRRSFRLECELNQAARFFTENPTQYLTGDKNDSGTWGKFITRDDDWEREWCGGSVADLERDLKIGRDTSKLQAVKEKLAREVSFDKLKEALGSGRSTRKRTLSEHDGEWDFDRRFELAPYSRTVRTPPKTRVMRIVAHGAANSGTGAKELDAFGALVWSISELLEERGIQTEVIYAAKVARTSETTPASVASLFVRLKPPGQYVSPGALAAALQTNFYRRLMFGFIVCSADYFSERVDESLGRGEQESVKAEPGTLHLSCDVHRGFTPELLKQIMEAIG